MHEVKTMRGIIVNFVIACLAIECFGARNKLIVPEDYPTIQQAINMAQPGDLVEIKPGVYEEAITLKEGVILKGVERDKVIVRWDTAKQPIIEAVNCKTGAISGLTLTQTNIKSPEKNENFFSVIQLDSSSIKISRCTIQNGGGDGIRIDGQSSCKILDCTIQGNAGNGILAWHQGVNPVIKNNTCSNNGINGVYFLEGAAGLAENNVCQGNMVNGISAYNKWTSPDIKNNRCLANKGSGIYLGDGAKGNVENNTCSENKWHGIVVADDSSAPTLKSNQCVNNERCGIYYSYYAHITAKDNVVKNNGEINFRQLRDVFWEEKFDELEEEASKLRTEKRLFSNGNSQLQWFYHSLGEKWPGYKPSVEDKVFGILNRWIEKKPESVTPRIVLARAYLAYAWHARGGKFARDVPEYAWDIFHEKLEKAWEVLTEAEKLKGKDPELYRLFIMAGMGLNKSDREMDRLFKKGVEIDKTYYHLYSQRAVSLLPRWGGLPGQLKQFAEQSAELNKGEDGEILYAKIVGDTVTKFHNLGPDRFKALDFSYGRAQKGHILILNKYPEATYYLNTYCLLASIYMDKETARELFDKIGSDWECGVWSKEEHFNKHKSWAYE